jgi:hypothetical protein
MRIRNPANSTATTVKRFLILTLKSFKKSNVITHLNGVTTFDNDILYYFTSLWSLTESDVITHPSGVTSDNDIITSLGHH